MDKAPKNHMDKKQFDQTSEAQSENNSQDINHDVKFENTNYTESINTEESVDGLKNQLETLMNSLVTLSAEKSRMEASFQNEKKQIRSEKEEYEHKIKQLKEKLKRVQNSAMSELEHLKYKLIMERHEREKELNNHASITKEMQKSISSEQKAREQLETQIKELKNTVSNKSQNKSTDSEIDLLRSKLKQAEIAVSETPALLQSLQSEMMQMKKKHKNALIEEQRRSAAAEQEARLLAATHESRVAGLEARLAELSDIVGGYDRHRQQDQKAIQSLKEQLIIVQDNKKIDGYESAQNLVAKIKELYWQLLEIDKTNSSTNVKDLLNSLKLCDKSQDFIHKEKYEIALNELEELKKSITIKDVKKQNESYHTTDDTQLHRAKSHNKNLEEKLRMSIVEWSEKEKELNRKIEKQQQIIQEQFLKTEQLVAQKESEYLNKIGNLEQQLLKQRERSLGIIQEKDKEIQMLKSSFDALIPRKNISEINQKTQSKLKNVSMDTKDLVSGLLSTENNPPILYYTQELARKEVQISNLRKQNIQIEAALRELERNSFHLADNYEGEIKKLEASIKNLEASKSREGANLEYLKNVFISYLTSKDISKKRHMLNAISTVLQFTTEENEKILKPSK